MRVITIGTLVIVATAVASSAQQPAPKPGFTVQGEFRGRYERRDNADFRAANRNDPQDGLVRLRLGLRHTWEDGSSVYLQPQLSLQETRMTGARNGSDRDPHVHQLYADLKAEGLRWRVGRQELAYGDERLVGAANWLSKGRSWDGARVQIADSRTKTDLFAGVLGQFDFKMNEPTLAGIYSTITRSPTASYDLYALFKNAPLASSRLRVYTVGARPVLKLGKGLDAKAEAAYQFGSNGGRQIDAYAYAAVLGYTPRTSIGLRVFVERDYASGGNPAGTGVYRTFDQLFPTNHGHYGLADFVGWRNMENWRIGAQAKPMARLSVSADAHFFRLADARDFWYGELGRPVNGAAGAPLRDAAGASGREIGTELDFVATYAVSKETAVSLGYARFMPGSFVRRVNGGSADASNWFYAQASVAF